MAVPFRALALAYRIVACVLILTGILRVSGITVGAPTWTTFLYFTTLSNVLCLVWLVMSAVRTAQDARDAGWRGFSTPSARFEGAVMMAITVTMLIYLIVLVPSTFSQPGTYEPFTLTDNLVHIITPVLVIVDWLLFVPKRRFRPLDPLRWALIPWAYLVLAFGYSALGGRFGGGAKYPYPFMDVDVLGVGGVAVWVLALSVSLIGVGYVYYGIDRMLGHPRLTPRAVDTAGDPVGITSASPSATRTSTS